MSVLMTAPSEENEPGGDLPQASDGFHRPSEEVRRRNVITVIVILVLLSAWIFMGFRNAFFG